MSKRRLYDLLTVLPVDARTLLRACHREGIKVTYVGKSGPLVSENDFERIKSDGIPYHQDRMTKDGLR